MARLEHKIAARRQEGTIRYLIHPVIARIIAQVPATQVNSEQGRIVNLERLLAARQHLVDARILQRHVIARARRRCLWEADDICRTIRQTPLGNVQRLRVKVDRVDDAAVCGNKAQRLAVGIQIEVHVVPAIAGGAIRDHPHKPFGANEAERRKLELPQPTNRRVISRIQPSQGHGACIGVIQFEPVVAFGGIG